MRFLEDDKRGEQRGDFRSEKKEKEKKEKPAEEEVEKVKRGEGIKAPVISFQNLPRLLQFLVFWLLLHLVLVVMAITVFPTVFPSGEVILEKHIGWLICWEILLLVFAFFEAYKPIKYMGVGLWISALCLAMVSILLFYHGVISPAFAQSKSSKRTCYKVPTVPVKPADAKIEGVFELQPEQTLDTRIWVKPGTNVEFNSDREFLLLGGVNEYVIQNRVRVFYDYGTIIVKGYQGPCRVHIKVL